VNTALATPRAARSCFRHPVAEIADSARYLDAAVSAHLSNEVRLAEELILLANNPLIREWTESIWGSNSSYVQFIPIQSGDLAAPRQSKDKERMPPISAMREIHQRDGYHCRFCGIPVIRAEVRKRIVAAYPHLDIWGRTNKEQHAGFQAMWAQYDHVVPHAKGGTSGLDNLILTCAPCNFGRMQYTLEEVGLADPRTRDPVRSTWDGLERFR
jgi:HNH endonuclease